MNLLICELGTRVLPSLGRRYRGRALAPAVCLACLLVGISPGRNAPSPPAINARPSSPAAAEVSPARANELAPRRDEPESRLASRVPLLGDAEAWRCLPDAQRDGGRPLPAWARALAGPLPHTCAAMLELDYLHRARSPIDAKLRGQMRWVAAHANRCRYSETYAAADLLRAGADEEAIRGLAGDLSEFPEPTRSALAFAEKLTLSADTVTDDEVAHLIGQYGEARVVAMVLLLAYANFQDRLILALDLPLGPGEPLAPLDVSFTRPPPGIPVTTAGRRHELEAALTSQRTATRRAGPSGAAALGIAAPAVGRATDPEWGTLDYLGLQREMEQQRSRRPRIAMPPSDPGASQWGLVCQGYQPALAGAWGACARAFGYEAEQDPLLEASVFWVVTRTLHCFY